MSWVRLSAGMVERKEPTIQIIYILIMEDVDHNLTVLGRSLMDSWPLDGDVYEWKFYLMDGYSRITSAEIALVRRPKYVIRGQRSVTKNSDKEGEEMTAPG
jgi:hypothetical protein